ncbi:hypothetical protein [Catenuloplanes atrovinosus]|uniref:Uncharacterized protein n=1 Tax=Catenuloplanes atrovinosus TaxID=137266 RepID=A0AAE4CF32_9ACTN|nr:hypothetical protein [Catenuloplanes atrovinosus]MDR7279225.1 hypothetical protein [Catenuloplanes atrovinosus]
MRHVGSVLVSLLLAPVIWILVGAGLNRWGGTPSPSTIFGLLALLTAGTFYAPLVLVRLSPAGPGLTGLLYLAASCWAGLAPTGWAATMPDSALGAHGAVEDPALHAAALLAIPLLGTLLDARRWRGYDHVPPIATAASWPPPRAAVSAPAPEKPPWPPVPAGLSAVPAPRRPPGGRSAHRDG